ncbi:hypothetical protein T4D_4866 [Trichinella pseudospiralis]|uniref:Uncharacterized protein n=1 Tax=Trichinella pseudospiralis TaxID=6337 RepID=A0A0V1G5E5_TRIPS|nr:hypothetical protein T4D_4866 [Trichinella pseudospiralis]
MLASLTQVEALEMCRGRMGGSAAPAVLSFGLDYELFGKTRLLVASSEACLILRSPECRLQNAVGLDRSFLASSVSFLRNCYSIAMKLVPLNIVSGWPSDDLVV